MEGKTPKTPFRFIFEDFGLILLSVGLFIGGIFLLSVKIPFWSLFLGIAAVQVGIVLIILAFDALIKRKTKPVTEDYKMLPCLICKRGNLVPKYSRVTICDECQIRVANTFKAATMIVFTLVTLTATVSLVSQSQDLREKAAEQPSLVCEVGEWEPDVCQCGNWQAAGPGGSACEEGEESRACSNGKNYCCEEVGNTWQCRRVDSGEINR